MNTQQFPPLINATEPPATDDDLPITVPIRMLTRAAGTMEMRVVADRRAPNDVAADAEILNTPIAHIANRATLAVALAESRLLAGACDNTDGDTAEDLVQPGVRPRLRVVRGRKLNAEYAINDGPNFIGRRDDHPIAIDLEDQEPAERIWTSRKHAVLHFVDGSLEIEDLNSLNGTFVNRIRLAPGDRRSLSINDIVQVGTIQLRVVA